MIVNNSSTSTIRDSLKSSLIFLSRDHSLVSAIASDQLHKIEVDHKNDEVGAREGGHKDRPQVGVSYWQANSADGTQAKQHHHRSGQPQAHGESLVHPRGRHEHRVWLGDGDHAARHSPGRDHRRGVGVIAYDPAKAAPDEEEGREGRCGQRQAVLEEEGVHRGHGDKQQPRARWFDIAMETVPSCERSKDIFYYYDRQHQLTYEPTMPSRAPSLPATRAAGTATSRIDFSCTC